MIRILLIKSPDPLLLDVYGTVLIRFIEPALDEGLVDPRPQGCRRCSFVVLEHAPLHIPAAHAPLVTRGPGGLRAGSSRVVSTEGFNRALIDELIEPLAPRVQRALGCRQCGIVGTRVRRSVWMRLMLCVDG